MVIVSETFFLEREDPGLGSLEYHQPCTLNATVVWRDYYKQVSIVKVLMHHHTAPENIRNPNKPAYVRKNPATDVLPAVQTTNFWVFFIWLWKTYLDFSYTFCQSSKRVELIPHSFQLLQHYIPFLSQCVGRRQRSWGLIVTWQKKMKETYFGSLKKCNFNFVSVGSHSGKPWGKVRVLWLESNLWNSDF